MINIQYIINHLFTLSVQFVNILFPCFISPPNAKCSTDCCNVSVFALRFKILDIRMCIHLSRINVVVHLFT